jgi:hypothetical protein
MVNFAFFAPVIIVDMAQGAAKKGLSEREIGPLSL